MIVLVASMLSPVLALALVLALGRLARLNHSSTGSFQSLVRLVLLFALGGAGATLVLTIAWMIWYEHSTGFSAGNGPLGWIFVYGPIGAALGEICALAVWWFKKPNSGANLL